MTPRAPEQRIGPYEVLFELGHGGMGTVYLARAIGEPVGVGGFERLVAIKRLHLHLLAHADAVQRFLEEAKMAARIHHANVVGIHQVGGDEAGHFLVQDYVEGDTLEGLIDYASLKRRLLPPPVVLRIAVDALAGLHAVHEATGPEGRPLGILHRDVSTQNLLVGRDGVTRLADFGIAKYAQSSVVTDAQYLQGRVLYMPPEYLARGPVDRRFDVYGMGVTLWIALTGGPPWAGASDAQIVHAATTGGVPRLSSSGLAIAHAIEEIVARACRRAPEERFATAREMLDAIEEVGRHTGWVASHGEVADLVEELAGRELAARRAAVVRSHGGRTPANVTPEGTGTTATMEMPAGVPRPRRGGVAIVGVGAVIAVIGAAAIGVSMRGAVPRAAGGATASATATATATAMASAMASATTTATATTTTSAMTTASGRRSATPGRGPGARATGSAAPSAPPAPDSGARGAASPAPTDPSPAPSTIATQNPYR